MGLGVQTLHLAFSDIILGVSRWFIWVRVEVWAFYLGFAGMRGHETTVFSVVFV